MLRIDQAKIPACFPEISLKENIASIIDVGEDEIKEIIVLKKSIDARKERKVYFIYSLLLSLMDENLESAVAKSGKAKLVEGLPGRWSFPAVRVTPPGYPVIVVGAGPSGLFASLTLAHYGFDVVLIERGKKIEDRVRDVSAFWRKGILSPESNIQFGEGGAGTFSDGKLTTRIKGPEAGFVIDTFSEMGGGAELRIEGKPHMGTDRLRKVALAFRERLLQMGITILYRKRVVDLQVTGGRLRGVTLESGEDIMTRAMVFAPGHSARDNYPMLVKRGAALRGKPFAVGVRVEHPQSLIDEIQYGDYAGCGCLPPANYRLAVRTSGGRPVYSFCMCPGGFVILSSSEGGDLPVNGMSPTGRRTGFANSGVVAAVGPGDYGSGLFDGLEFQRRLERNLFELTDGNYSLLSSSLNYFLSGAGRMNPSEGRWAGSGRKTGDLRRIFPENIYSDLAEGITLFDRKMKGFISDRANLYGVESRTSSPIRISRGKNFQSITIEGLYPAGEGAGYAGGIVSSAVDGIRSAMAIVKKFSS